MVALGINGGRSYTGGRKREGGFCVREGLCPKRNLHPACERGRKSINITATNILVQECFLT